MLQQIHNGQKELIQNDEENDLPVRLIINYAKFNSKVKKKFSVHPQITCRDAINRLQSANFAAKMDVTNIFYHLSIKPSMRGTLSFCYADYHLTMTVLMHGLVFASAI